MNVHTVVTHTRIGVTAVQHCSEADDASICSRATASFILQDKYMYSSGYRTLRHQDTLGHFGTDLKTLRHQKRGTRHFDTGAVIDEKPGHFDPGQFR